VLGPKKPPPGRLCARARHQNGTFVDKELAANPRPNVHPSPWFGPDSSYQKSWGIEGALRTASGFAWRANFATRSPLERRARAAPGAVRCYAPQSQPRPRAAERKARSGLFSWEHGPALWALEDAAGAPAPPDPSGRPHGVAPNLVPPVESFVGSENRFDLEVRDRTPDGGSSDISVSRTETQPARVKEMRFQGRQIGMAKDSQGDDVHRATHEDAHDHGGKVVGPQG
jgi:hypothetical protein